MRFRISDHPEPLPHITAEAAVARAGKAARLSAAFDLKGENRMPRLCHLLLLLGVLLCRSTYASSKGCEGFAQVLQSGHMNLGVKLDVTDPVVREQFGRAMDFWAGLLDMEWYRDQTAECAIQVSYSGPETFDTDDIAQADDPDSNTFRGEIAFNPTFDMTPLEAYLVSIHEIGHLLGLDHNPSPTSVMHAVYLEGPEKLEAADIAALSARHRMRRSNNTEICLSFEVVEAAEVRSAIAKSKVSSTR